MQVSHRRQAERSLQQDLPGRARQQVAAAHDVGDALCRVVHDDRQLVGIEAVPTPQHEVADGGRDVDGLRAQAAVVEGDRAGRNTQPQGLAAGFGHASTARHSAG